jgi:DNA-binding NtrC family response regulator
MPVKMLSNYKTEGVNGHKLLSITRDPPALNGGFHHAAAEDYQTKIGVYDGLTKPMDQDQSRRLMERAVREGPTQDEVPLLPKQPQSRSSFQNIITKNAKMLALFELIHRLADTTSTVLIEGETGTGKEQVARAIHHESRNRSGPFIAVNCAALPENLLESELFGHEKGSFTSAAGMRRGRFELANGGTLFLDEVGDIPAPMQTRLLRVLQERCFERVGGAETVEVDVRVIAASNRSLSRLVKEGSLREDLFYRLNVIKIELPPLRERAEDIPSMKPLLSSPSRFFFFVPFGAHSHR